MRVSRLGRGLPLAPAIVLALLALTDPEAASAQAQAQPREEGALSTRIDSLMRSLLDTHQIPGASLVVVHNGRELLKSGYGLADLRTRRPVDPDTTLFGIASVGKVVTALALLQLVGDGRLTLSDPVDRHWPSSFTPSGLRIWHLLTHTGGFGEQTIGTSARSAQQLQALAEYVRSEQPPVARPPGTTTSYSNYGFALAGAIVEHLSGESFEDYVDRAIFRPAGMTSSSFAQPLPSRLRDHVATAYMGGTDGPSPLPRIYFNDRPASAMFTTASDMGRLLEVLLDPAIEPGLLGATGTDTLLARHFGNHDALPGVALGMYESNALGHRTLAQGGDWQDFSAQLFLLPGAALGMFAAFNAGNGNEAAVEVWAEVVEQLIGSANLPDRTERRQAPAESDLSGFAGKYRLNRYSRHTLARLGALVGAVPEIEVSREGSTLSMFGAALKPIGDGVMVRGDTGTRVAFRDGPDGDATHLFFASAPTVAYERLRLWEHALAHQLAFLLLLAVFATISWRELRRRWPSDQSTWRIMIICSLAVNLVYLVAILTVVAVADPWAFQYGIPGSVRVVLWISYLLPASAIFLTGLAVRTPTETTSIGRGTFACYAAVSWLLVVLLGYWRILGVRV